jgi:hypothetical protein
MTRLTKYEKNAFVHKYLDYTFEKRRAQQKIWMHSLGKELYQNQFNQETIDKMYALPNGWLMEIDYLYVNANGYQIYLKLPELVRVPHSFELRIKSPASLSDEFQRYANAENLLHEDEQLFKNKLTSLIYRVTTHAQLLKLLPEVEKFLPNSPVATQTTALTVTAQEIVDFVKHERGTK